MAIETERLRLNGVESSPARVQSDVFTTEQDAHKEGSNRPTSWYRKCFVGMASCQ